jgi:DNA polymerase-3 subunit delta'
MCGTCKNCLQVLGHTHPDTMWLRGEPEEKIKIDQVRDIIRFMSQTNVTGYKVCVIKNAENMIHEAANALLKVLEEPPANAHFILTVNNINSLLPTIISRCRVMRFNLVSNTQIIGEFKKVIPTTKDLKAVLPFVNGRPGRLISLLENEESFDRQKEWYKTVNDVINKYDITERFQLVQQITQDEQDIKRFLTNMLYYLREELRERKNKEKVVSLVRTVERAKELIQANVNPKLVLEHVMLEIS